MTHPSFEDDGTAYLLFGNTNPAIAQLGEDMVTVIDAIMKNLVGLHDFREAVTVLRRVSLHVVLRRYRQRGLSQAIVLRSIFSDR
ncbi:hypothetical protein M4D81_28635 [Paenibacillus sp. p3-SID867]|uniref:hypothetical protein n=1 Tax=Paenibacillus sp. p3-SID867 TaxID=2916363 RepID=UPI0021A45B1E|nr:hypothetical protein [Paenibacillus sp. p3-SID867]MCT1402965.1 hypothetical protein [Paenibacillus sp. p3-SID867]